MTRENRNLLINTVLVIVVSVTLLILFASYVPTTSADKVFGSKVKTEEKEFFRLPETIDKVEKVYKGDNYLGLLYTASAENAYGPITLKVGIEDNDKRTKREKIIGVYQSVEQNYPEKHHSLQVHKYVESLIGTYLIRPENIDGVTEPTTVVTLGTIHEILKNISNHYYFITEEEEEITEGVKFVEELENGNKVYNASGTYIYVGQSEGLISFNFEIDKDLNLVSYEEIEYTHTPGNFKDNAIKFLNGLKGKSIKTIKTDNDDIDGNVGATNTAKAIIDLLDQVYEFIMEVE